MKRCLTEILIRFFLYTIYRFCQTLEPFERIIQPEEQWLYKYPHMESYLPMPLLWLLALTIPSLVIIIYYVMTANKNDFIEAVSCFSLIVTLNSALTNIMKVIVGRPRPDYFARCYPSGQIRGPCRGSSHLVADGRKSFPSGHSSVAFASFGFLSLYLAGKLRLLPDVGDGRTSARLCATLLPLVFAMGVAVSRTCDYHHHWQDVTVGSLLGLCISCICYFLYYPPLHHEQSHQSWREVREQQDMQGDAMRVKII